MFKKALMLGTMLTAGFGAAAPAVLADQTATTIDAYYVPMHFTFDGKEYAPGAAQRGFIWDDTSYVPLRFVSYALDKAVDWDQDTYTVTVRKPSLPEQVTIDDYKLNAQVHDAATAPVPTPSNGRPMEVQAYFETVHYVFDGKTVSPPEDKPGIIMDGTLYVPIRFYSESVGQTIGWDQTTYTVSASTPEAEKPATTGKAGNGTGTASSGQASGAPASQPGTTTGSIPAGGGAIPSGGSTSAKPTLASIEANTEAQLNSMESNAHSYFLGLALQYLSEPVRNADVKARYMATGEAALSGYDSQFTSIMNDLAAQLTANGYDSAPEVKKYTDAYEAKKAAAESSVQSLAH